MLARTLAWTVVHLRFLFVPAWIAAAVLATVYLPSLNETEASSLSSMIPKDSAAVAAEQTIIRKFGYPLFSRIQIVQRDPRELTTAAQARAVGRAVDMDRGLDKQRYPYLLGAIPLVNTGKYLPGSREDSTTAVTYLFVDPRLDIFTQRQLAEGYAAQQVNEPDDHLVGVTGAIPARAVEGDLVTKGLPRIEIATVLLIALIVGLHFRSVLAPVVTLAAAGIAYTITVPVLAFLGQRTGVAVPQEIEPLVVVLLLGVVTDYSIFFLSGMRSRLAEGRPAVEAAKATTSELARIILTAGMVVAAATAALVVTSVSFFRALGPGLAITVAIGLLVSVTFVPAVMAMFGRALFWPATPSKAADRPGSPPQPVDAGSAAPASPAEPVVQGWRSAIVRGVTRKPVAAVVTVVLVGGLLFAASFLRQTGLGISLPDELPSSSEVSAAATAAGEGFAPGVTSPTEVLLQGPGIQNRLNQVARLVALVSKTPGVAGVVGPGTLPPEATPTVFVSKDESAARLIVILDQDPLGSAGLHELEDLQAVMPTLLRHAGLTGVTAGFAGDSALADETVQQTLHGLGAIALAALAIDFVLLAIFLRALVAPLYLLAASALVVAAALGLTTLVFQDWLGHPGLTYYVPFATAVLLVALGSDYNVFVVGRIWQEARTMPLRDAIRLAAPRASRAIGVAGLALAGTFALLALVPLVPFREFAFAMCVGVLIDSFLVRALLVPSLMTLFGRTSQWPGRRSAPLPEPTPQEADQHRVQSPAVA
ncbi:MAG TPA: MMPL family transporter [Actinomycetota bacterium]|nr:MMPL family transporter [Actinomycetota bacterium]